MEFQGILVENVGGRGLCFGIIGAFHLNGSVFSSLRLRSGCLCLFSVLPGRHTSHAAPYNAFSVGNGDQSALLVRPQDGHTRRVQLIQRFLVRMPVAVVPAAGNDRIIRASQVEVELP